MDVTSHCSGSDITESVANKNPIQSECISSQPTANGTLPHHNTGETGSFLNNNNITTSSTFCVLIWFLWHHHYDTRDWWHHINSFWPENSKTVSDVTTGFHIGIHIPSEPEEDAARRLPVSGRLSESVFYPELRLIGQTSSRLQHDPTTSPHSVFSSVTLNPNTNISWSQSGEETLTLRLVCTDVYL